MSETSPSPAAPGENGRPDHELNPGTSQPASPDRPEVPVSPAAGPPEHDRRRPKIGDSRPAPPAKPSSRRRSNPPHSADPTGPDEARPARSRRRGGRGRSGSAGRAPAQVAATKATAPLVTADGQRHPPAPAPAPAGPAAPAPATRRPSGRERRGRPVGRYLMCVQVQPEATQVAVLEGRSLVEHYVSLSQDRDTQIDGNIYLGRVESVLPGMEAAFVEIGTTKNAVLYRGDVRYDREDVEGVRQSEARIEELLRPRQAIVCQVTKNPIAAKGARLTQEVSLPGRFVVLIPNSASYGISKRLGDEERRRLRRILDDLRPAGHGLIVRTAAEGASPDDLERDVGRLLAQWDQIDAAAHRSPVPFLLYREPDVALRIIREEFNQDYRGVVIDDPAVYAQVRDYVASISPELADRVELHDQSVDPLPIFERYHVHEQLHKALDRKVWLPSGGSLIIERTEALTVIDVNTARNVGRSSLEETVYRNNLEAADEVARQLRLRDIGGIIVIDFIDMEAKGNRDSVNSALRDALARDKTRTQAFAISELGLVEMTRKRVSEGLVESFSQTCPTCNGRGIVFDHSLL